MNRLYEWIDGLWNRFSQTIFVRFQYDLPLEVIRTEAARGRAVFAVPNCGLIEWLILSSWCRAQGLGAVLVANRKRILFFSKPLYFFQILFKRRSYADLFLSEEKGPRLMVVQYRERKRLQAPTRVEALLAEIQRKGGGASPFALVTVLIIWRRFARGAARRPSEYLLGMASSPNLLGKLWYLARRRMDSTVKGLEPFSLGATEGNEVDGGEEDDEVMRLARTARRKVLVLHSQEMRVVLGPTFRTPLAVKETIMKDAALQQLISELVEAGQGDRRKLMAQAYRDLTEIVAKYSFRFIEVLYVLLTWLFTKVFEGMEVREDDLKEVREVMKNKPVVFVPCHRSHLDYLVIPYVLFLNEMVTPHIAAGVNLSFWPVGGLLRRGGAFFIRRSFRGDPLYALALKKYVEYLLANRYNIKFFIEGTRSRSGKMLAPAYGMLKMVFESYLRNACDDVAFVPVSIGYDEVPEQGSYTRELAGGEKEKESASSLIKSRKIIQRKFGKVYVRFAKPLYAKELLPRGEGADSDEVTLALQKCAFQICKAINDVTPVTPKALIASVVLSHRLGAVPLEDLLRLSLLLAEYVESCGGAPLAIKRGEGLRRAIEHTVRGLQKSGVLNVSSSVPRNYFCENRKRILLAYYRNNGIHCLLSPALTVLAAFQEGSEKGFDGKLSVDGVLSRARRLRDLLKFEFFFGATPQFLAEMRANLEFFLADRLPEGGHFRLADLRARFDEWNDLSVLLRMPGDIVEAYALALQFLKDHSDRTFDAKSLAQKMFQSAESKGSGAGLAFPEALSVQLFTNAVKWLTNRGLIIAEAGPKPSFRVLAWSKEHDDAARELAQILEVMQKDPEAVVDPTKETRLH